MPAKSKAQQQAMGIAHAAQKYGKKVKPGTPSAQIAKSMKPKDVEKYAKTKHKGLPKRVKQEQLREMIREVIHEVLSKREPYQPRNIQEARKVDRLRQTIRELIADTLQEIPLKEAKKKIKVQCQECGKKFSTSSMDPKCPKCKGYDIDLAYETVGLQEALTKKDFIMMAKEIQKASPQYKEVLTRFAIIIGKKQNPRFDEERFRKAALG